MNTRLAFILSITLVSMLVSSHASAMEQSGRIDKKMTDKKTDKKMDDKKKTIKKKVKTSEKKSSDKNTDKKKMDKKIADTISKPKMIGKVDVSMASPIQGSTDAKVTVIEFGDYQCPKCFSWFTKEKPTIESQYIATGKANLIFVDLSFLGADSDSAVIASYCADEQGKYWDYHNKLYKSQGGIQSGWASNANLKKFASEIGLDSSKFDSCLDSGKHSNKIKYNLAVASSAGAQGTPTFLIVGPNGATEKITGPQPASVFSGVIDKFLK